MTDDATETFREFFPKAAPADVGEPFLIAKLSSKRRYEAWAATIVLRQLGTNTSVEALKVCCLRPIQDLQVTSIFTLQAIQGNDVADFAVSLLKNAQYREKWAAMIVACESCGPTHRDALESRLKRAVSRKRACPNISGLNSRSTEVLHFLRYLERTHQMLGRVGRFLWRKKDFLTPSEQHEVLGFIEREGQGAV